MSRHEGIGPCPHCGCPFYSPKPLVVRRRSHLVAAAVALTCATGIAIIITIQAARAGDLILAGIYGAAGLVLGYRADQAWCRAVLKRRP